MWFYTLYFTAILTVNDPSSKTGYTDHSDSVCITGFLASNDGCKQTGELMTRMWAEDDACTKSGHFCSTKWRCQPTRDRCVPGCKDGFPEREDRCK